MNKHILQLLTLSLLALAGQTAFGMDKVNKKIENVKNYVGDKINNNNQNNSSEIANKEKVETKEEKKIINKNKKTPVPPKKEQPQEDIRRSFLLPSDNSESLQAEPNHHGATNEHRKLKIEKQNSVIHDFVTGKNSFLSGINNLFSSSKKDGDNKISKEELIKLANNQLEHNGTVLLYNDYKANHRDDIIRQANVVNKFFRLFGLQGALKQTTVTGAWTSLAAAAFYPVLQALFERNTVLAQKLMSDVTNPRILAGTVFGIFAFKALYNLLTGDYVDPRSILAISSEQQELTSKLSQQLELETQEKLKLEEEKERLEKEKKKKDLELEEKKLEEEKLENEKKTKELEEKKKNLENKE